MTENTPVLCVICGGDEWKLLGSVYSGSTARDGAAIQRTEEAFPLGACVNCGHVRSNHNYDSATFNRIYAAENQQPVSWGDAGVHYLAPYVEMVELVGGKSLAATTDLIVDIGCGHGRLLEALADHFDVPETRLLGVDFNRMLPERFSFAQADLNTGNLATIVGAERAVAVVMSSHVIEHVTDPRRFLRQLRRLLEKGNGRLYLETPDFSALDPSAADVCNLLHPQHINYFTATSLDILLRSTGFAVDHMDTHVTGLIPRLRCVARLALKEMPAAQISNTLNVGALVRRSIAERLERESDTAILWGCGGDLWRLVEENPAVRTLLESGKVRLADRAVAGGVLHGHEIISSAEIRHHSGPVIILPAYFGTRGVMLNFANSEGFGDRVVDPYTH